MNKNRLKCISAFGLKATAMALMLCDHLWAVLIPGNRWLTDIGRMAFPIFAFQVAEGFFQTGNYGRYLKRMFIWALISEIPFNLMYSGEIIYPYHQNVLFTFCTALLFMRWMEKSREKGRRAFVLCSAASVILGFLAGTLSMCDYFGFGVLTVLVFYIFRNIRSGWAGELICLIWINGFMMAGLDLQLNIFGHEIFFPQQAIAVFALIPIWMYSGKQGPHGKKVQLLCYAFYPVHMLILSALRLIL